MVRVDLEYELTVRLTALQLHGLCWSYLMLNNVKVKVIEDGILVISYIRDKAIYWPKIVIFSYPSAFDALVRGVSLETGNTVMPFCGSVWKWKN